MPISWKPAAFPRLCPFLIATALIWWTSYSSGLWQPCEPNRGAAPGIGLGTAHRISQQRSKNPCGGLSNPTAFCKFTRQPPPWDCEAATKASMFGRFAAEGAPLLGPSHTPRLRTLDNSYTESRHRRCTQDTYPDRARRRLLGVRSLASEVSPQAWHCRVMSSR